jgi:hypothetical protein
MRRIARKTGISRSAEVSCRSAAGPGPTAKRLAETNPAILTYVNLSLKQAMHLRRRQKTAATAFNSNGAVLQLMQVNISGGNLRQTALTRGSKGSINRARGGIPLWM